MKWVWTWKGICFGYVENDNLRTHDGKHVGKLHGEEIYGIDGDYLGEVMNENRLITCRSKMSWRKGPFAPFAKNAGYAKYANYAGYAMYAGHEDFPLPESF